MVARKRAIRIILFMTRWRRLKTRKSQTIVIASEAKQSRNRATEKSPDYFVAFAPRNDDGEGKRKWRKQRQQLEPQPANACAARSPSRSTCRRGGRGMIIQPQAAARMARPMRPMSEAGASGFASPRVRA